MPYYPLPTIRIDPDIKMGIGWSSRTSRYQFQDSLIPQIIEISTPGWLHKYYKSSCVTQWCHITRYRPLELTQISKWLSVDPPVHRDINSRIIWSAQDIVEILQIVLCDAIMPYCPLPTIRIDPDIKMGIGWSSRTSRYQLQDNLECSKYCRNTINRPVRRNDAILPVTDH